MAGLAEFLFTKQDYYNAAQYLKAHNEDLGELLARLKSMKSSTTRMGLKAASYSMRAEKQHQEDYEPKPEPNCEMLRLGFTPEEIDKLIGELEND